MRLTVESEAPLMQILMKRAINAVLRFALLSEESVENATTAPTDLAVLVRALSSGEIIDDLRTVEPLAPAFIRGIDAKRRLIEEHGGTLIALTTGRRGYRYPIWQFRLTVVLNASVHA